MNSSSNSVSNRLIVSLDVDNLKKAQRLVEEVSPWVRVFKVGYRLFTRAGREIVEFIQHKGAEVFLDLKFYDIPHTVRECARSLVHLKVSMFDVHTMGGFRMMQETVEVCVKEARRLKVRKPLILGVTLLTSFDSRMLKEIGIEKGIEEYTLYLARLAKKAGLDGVIASAREIEILRNELGKEFLIITPGIRLLDKIKEDDQKRTSNPREAIKKGADYIVIGRPIINSSSPQEMVRRIVEEIGE
ncbi:MAG: orotidine-5'-phosphate decarboxylase [Candidatus Omnitrophota bacterium]|nr:MAG: orotidine-5'-phosphate decarboxylase [Candidatus Omnitrophota bacterium]